jgi:SNF2 family DNA or RNA helicase
MKRWRICVQLDPASPYFDRAYILVRSLLTAYEIDQNVWTIGFHDLTVLREKLDQMGLIEGRTISEEAYQRISWLHSLIVRNDNIKTGVNNEQVRAALDGKLKTPLYEDQLPAVSFAMTVERCGIFDEMGSGKSLESLAAVVALGDKVRRTLLICPYTVQMAFMREIKKHTHLKAVQIPTGRKKALQLIKELKDQDWDVMLVHPENLIAGGRGGVYGDITKLLKTMPWDLILIDEFHMFKNLQAKRTKCVISLLTESRSREGKWPRCILLTGTPVSESPMNAYAVLKVLSRDYLPHISKFEHHFVVKKNIDYGSKGTHPKVVGYKNLDELKSMIEAVSIRRTKAEMVGFPDRVSLVRDVQLSGKQLALYRTICGEIAAELPKSSVINLMKFLSGTTTVLRLRQVMNHPNLLDEEGDSAKYKEIDLLLEEVLEDPEQKVILWTEFRKAVDNLYSRYNSKYGAVKIYGGITNEQLEDLAFQFEHEEKPRVAVAIPAKAGTGLDFLARARTAIYVDRPYSFTLYKQSIDRIHRRIGTGAQSKLDRIRAQPATLLFLDVVGSVDELVRDKLIGKQDLADALTTSDAQLLEMGKADLLRYLK